MKPLLAQKFHPKRLLPYDYFFVQPKLNGVRALYQAGHFQSRDEIPWNDSVLAHLIDELRGILPSSIILDGELYLHGKSLQHINGAVMVNRTGPRDDTHEIEFHVFDVVDFAKSFAERLEQVNHIGQQCVRVKIVETHRCTTEAQADDHYRSFIDQGYEGMMYRLGDCPYTWPKALRPNKYGKPLPFSDKNNRCWHLLKRKAWLDDEFRIHSVEEGKGKRAGMTGALICELGNGEYFAVGSGLTETECVAYWNNPPIGRMAKVKYQVLTPDGKPFHPTLIAVL